MKQSNLTPGGPMLNAYPDSMGATLSDIVSFLQRPELKDVFQSFYILPSLYHSDLDRGFSVIDYGINEKLANAEDLAALKNMGLELKLDFILNHASVQCAQFQDILKHGEQSEYKDFFIDWNKFWDGCGKIGEEGYLVPDEQLLRNMFFRKPGLPILKVRFPDGRDVPYWNTFYQEIRYPHLTPGELAGYLGISAEQAGKLALQVNRLLEEGKQPSEIDYGVYRDYRQNITELLESRRSYLGQMDLNLKSPLVWEYYEDTLKTLAGYGAKIIRLDAFAYAPKEPGQKNFLNEPGTWELLKRIRSIADRFGLTLLPEIHAGYSEKIYEKLADQGYMTYDFFLPGLILDAIEQKDGSFLAKWAIELQDRNIRTVHMLGCHDGIPILDLKGLLPQEQIKALTDTLVRRGGYIKNLHGKENLYYQVNTTYYSALGGDDQKMLLARALQIFMPGIPQVWYLDLFAGANDYEAVKRAGEGGHKEINRTNLSSADIETAIKREVVKKQLELLRLRNTCRAFGGDAEMKVEAPGQSLNIVWRNEGVSAGLRVDFETCDFQIRVDEK